MRRAEDFEVYERFMDRRLAADTASLKMWRHLVNRSRGEDGAGHAAALGAGGIDVVERFVDCLAHEVSRGGQLDVHHYRKLCVDLRGCGGLLTDREAPGAGEWGGYLRAWRELYAFVRHDRARQFGFYPEVLVCWIAGLLRTTSMLDPDDPTSYLLATRPLEQLQAQASEEGHEWFGWVMNPYLNKSERFAAVPLAWFERCGALAKRL